MKAFLALQDGTVLEGKALGASGTVIGEIVFTTNMCGFQEELTDPSFSGQIVVNTYPLVGGYGINSFDNESEKPTVKGLVVKEACPTPSNYRCEMNLDTYLKANNVVAIEDVDTRYLTRKIRDNGSMLAIISTDSKFVVGDKFKDFTPDSGVKAIELSTKKVVEYLGKERNDYTVAVLDYGVKKSAIEALCNLNCKVIRLPAVTDCEGVLSYKPNAIMLSSGAGDPSSLDSQLPEIAKLMSSGVPVLGVDFGHLLMARASKLKTVKMSFGHHGSNCPVKDIESDLVFATTQNHTYVVDSSVDANIAEITHINWHDRTVEGLKYKGKNVRSVQFNPETKSGPQPCADIYSHFVGSLKK